MTTVSSMQGDNRIERFDIDWMRGSNAMVERDNKRGSDFIYYLVKQIKEVIGN
jgi:hypothetical protein